MSGQIPILNVPYRESEGSFRYGNYRREADDLCAVVQHFRGWNYVITAIVGHSKGLSIIGAHIEPKHSFQTKRGCLNKYLKRLKLEQRIVIEVDSS